MDKTHCPFHYPLQTLYIFTIHSVYFHYPLCIFSLSSLYFHWLCICKYSLTLYTILSVYFHRLCIFSLSILYIFTILSIYFHYPLYIFTDSVYVYIRWLCTLSYLYIFTDSVYFHYPCSATWATNKSNMWMRRGVHVMSHTSRFTCHGTQITSRRQAHRE